MTLQQLEYVAAVDKYRHFVKAAEACGVTQSTLSSMIQKLEDELDVKIFDRDSHPVKPTKVGERVIEQAKVLLFNSSQLIESVKTEKEQETGEFSLAVIPTVAPYILPKMIRYIRTNHPKLSLRISEARTSAILDRMERAEIDAALLTTPLNNPKLLEIPVYYEKFIAYVSEGDPLSKKAEIESSKFPYDRLWVLEEGHCLRNQVLNICHHKSAFSAVYEAGSIDTLVRIVDENGGYTIIPQLHYDFLTERQKKNVRKIVNPEPVREISLVVRNDFVRERLLNIVSEGIRSAVPESMVDAALKKFAIRI